MCLPHAEHRAIRSVGVAWCLWLSLLRLDGVETVRGAILLPPLQGHQLVSEQGITRRNESHVRTGFVKGVTGVGFVPPGMAVVTDEVNRADRVVGMNLADNAAQTLTLVRAFLGERINAEAVKAQCEQPPVWRGVETHPLVHYRRRSGWKRAVGILDLRQSVFREDHMRIRPMLTVDGRHQQRPSGWNVLRLGGAEILEIKLTAPIGQIRLVIIGPADRPTLGRTSAIGAERLVIMDTNRVTECAVVESFVGLFLADITDGFRSRLRDSRRHRGSCHAASCAGEQQPCGCENARTTQQCNRCDPAQAQD